MLDKAAGQRIRSADAGSVDQSGTAPACAARRPRGVERSAGHELHLHGRHGVVRLASELVRQGRAVRRAVGHRRRRRSPPRLDGAGHRGGIPGAGRRADRDPRPGRHRAGRPAARGRGLRYRGAPRLDGHRPRARRALRGVVGVRGARRPRAALPASDRLPGPRLARRGARGRRARGGPAGEGRPQRGWLPRLAAGQGQGARAAGADRARAVAAADAPPTAPGALAGGAQDVPEAAVRRADRRAACAQAAAAAAPDHDPQRLADGLPGLLRRLGVVGLDQVRPLPGAPAGRAAAGAGRPDRTPAAHADHDAARALRHGGGRLGRRGRHPRPPVRGDGPPRAGRRARAARRPAAVQRRRGDPVPAPLQRGRAPAVHHLLAPGAAGDVRRRWHDDQQCALPRPAGRGPRAVAGERRRPGRAARRHHDRSRLAQRDRDPGRDDDEGGAALRPGGPGPRPPGPSRGDVGQHLRRLPRYRLLQHRLRVRRQAHDAGLRAPMGAAGARPRRAGRRRGRAHRGRQRTRPRDPGPGRDAARR
jgi:hypothetical protein